MDLFIVLFYTIIFLAVFLFLRHVIEIPRIGELNRKAVFITGCDSGFGRELVLKCLSEGMPVFAGCLTQEGIESLHRDAKYLEGILETLQLDVSSDKSVEEAGEFLEKRTVKYGGLHGIVNNAGIVGAPVPDDWLNINDYKKVLEVNTFGVIRVTHKLKHLVKRARGRIVTAASVLGRVAFAANGPYNVSKFGVEAYCDTIRRELEGFGVSVHILEPGFFNTQMTNEERLLASIERAWTDCSADVKAEYGVEFYEKKKASLKRTVNGCSSRVEYVVDAYFHALTARFPRCRYPVGYDANFVPLSLLPTFVQDLIYRAMQRSR